MSDEDTKAPTHRCPLCGKPRVLTYRPFCSKRCADIDLGRWLGGVYTVPGSALDDEDGDTAPQTPQERPEQD